VLPAGAGVIPLAAPFVSTLMGAPRIRNGDPIKLVCPFV